MNDIKVAVLSRSFGKAGDDPFRMLDENGFKYTLTRNNAPEDTDHTVELIGDADAVIVGSEKITSEVLEKCPQLKLISKHGVGLDAIDLAACEKKGVAVRNTPHANNDAVADLTIMLMLGVLRDLKRRLITSVTPGWESGPLSKDLFHADVGIIGFGNIGRGVAKRLEGFSCNICAYDPFIKEASVSGVRMVDLHELLGKSDIISIHAPLTDATRNMIDKDAVNSMKDGAIVINTARGGLMDYRALYEALVSGKLGGAGLDVYPQEPPVNEPLLVLPNVVATPHIATHSLGSNLKMGVAAVQNIIDFFNQ